MYYFIIEGFSNEKYCRQSEAREIAPNIDVGPEEEAEGKTANAMGCTIILYKFSPRGKFIPSSCEEL